MKGAHCEVAHSDNVSFQLKRNVKNLFAKTVMCLLIININRAVIFQAISPVDIRQGPNGVLIMLAFS